MSTSDTSSTSPKRITLGSMFNQFMQHLNLEKGLLFTLWALLAFPGKAVREYLFEDRKRLMRPLSFAFLMVGLSTFLMVGLMEGEIIKKLEIEMQQEAQEEIPLGLASTSLENLNQIIIKYRNVLQLSGIPLLALMSFLFFKKEKWFYAEHMVLGCYVIGFAAFISVLAALLFYVIHNLHVLGGITALSIFYQIYYYWNIFRTSKGAVWRAIVLNVVYLSLFGALMMGIVTLIVNFML